ncbi:uncharacterized protein LOC120775788 isoform X2 [Bactrocera tryoni]|uniref:uncharacterized protein LOC120775788 isoform X2 n=1 Tax=Bactrocera tryoni TaxID=59916 RepID=UPI001A9817E0|nr:uncharacterized protein LOC120775788 isoform X2 [Bactrocera tryoni]
MTAQYQLKRIKILLKYRNHRIYRFRDQKLIERFVRCSQLLKIIEGATELFIKRYRNSKKPEDALGALFVPLHFEYIHFIHNNANELLHQIIEEPLQFLSAAKYCVYGIVRDQIKLSGNTVESNALKSIDIDQLHIQLRFIGLPLQEDLHFAHYKNCWPPGLSWTTGILSAISEPQWAILQSTWFCSTGCNRNKIKSDSIDAPICNSCGQHMNEYAKLRVTEKYHFLRLLPTSCIENPRVVNKIFRALTVHCKEHVHDCELRLGTSYFIIGYYDYTRAGQIFQAWSVIIR